MQDELGAGYVIIYKQEEEAEVVLTTRRAD